MPDIQHVYSINNAIHIDEDNATHTTVVSSSLDRAKAIYNDPGITSQLKVDGGVWTGSIQTTSIIPHNDSLEYDNNSLSIGNAACAVTIDGTSLHLGDNLIIDKTNETYNLDIPTHNVKASNKLVINENTDAGYIEIDNDGASIQVGSLATNQLNLYSTTLITNASVSSFYADELTLDVNDSISIQTKQLNIPNYIYANDDTKELMFGNNTFKISNNSNIAINADNLDISASSRTRLHTDMDKEYIDMNCVTNNVTVQTSGDMLLKGVSGDTSIYLDDNDKSIAIKANTLTYDVASITNQIASLNTQSEIQQNTATTSITNNTPELINNVTVSLTNITPTLINNASTSITNTTPSLMNNASTSITNTTQTLSNVADNIHNISAATIKNTADLSITNETPRYNTTAPVSVSVNTSNMFSVATNISVSANVAEVHTTPLFRINDTSDLTHMLIDKTSNSITAKTQFMEVNGPAEKAHFQLDKGAGKVTIGSANTTSSTFVSKNINVTANTLEKHTTQKFEINDSTTGGYLNIDKNQSKIVLGSSSTGITDIHGSIMNVSASQQEIHTTPKFSINPTSSSAKLEMNSTTGNISVRAKNTINAMGNMVIRGSDTSVGSGALMVDNATDNTSLIVKQKDLVGNNDIVQIWGNGVPSSDTNSSNVDVEKVLVIDNEGRSSFGKYMENNRTFFKIDRDLDDILENDDLFMVSDNNTSRFIISRNGNIGIGTSDPQVVLHIEDDSAIKLPCGTTEERPLAETDTHKGYIRYNTSTDQFEGFGAGHTWGSLGGVMDVDQDTYIKAETNAGTDNDELQFVTAGSERMRIMSDGKVGIKHTAPEYDLDIGGDINFSGSLTCNSVDILEMFQRSLDFVYADKEASKLGLGDDTLNSMSINARDIVIGREGGSTKILGDFVAYGMGSNVTITNVTKESSSFVVENFGTDVGFQIKQVNVMECNVDALQIYVGNDENHMDMTMRVDGIGNVGIGGGINTDIGDSNLEAWLQIKGDANNSLDIPNPKRDLFRVDHYDDLDENPSIVVKDTGKIGIGVSEPRETLDVNGKTLSLEMTGGVVAKAMDIPTDAIIDWSLVDDDLDEVRNYGVSNLFFNGQVLNNNKRIVDLSAERAIEQQNNIMLWYKFDEITNQRIQNHADYNDMYHRDPNTTDSAMLFEEIPVIKRIRGVGGKYLLYFDSEVLLGNGDAYLYPKESDVPLLLEKMNRGFTYSVTVKTDDNSLPSISLFSIKTGERNIMNLKVIEDGRMRMTVGNNATGSEHSVTSIQGVEEQMETNVIFNLSVKDNNDNGNTDTIISIYIGGFLDSTLTITDFTPDFNIPDVVVRMGSEITPDISPIFIRDIKIFERSLEQTEIWGLNGLDIEGKKDRNVKVSATRDYLMEVDGNLKINDSLVINNGQVNKVLFSTGGQQYMSTNRDSKCQLGIILEWDHDLSHYPDVESYLFRASIRFHVSGSNENNNFGFRVFDAFISPKNDPNSGLPGSIISTNLSDTVANTFIISQSDIIRKGATKSLIIIEWRNLDEDSNSCRGYIDAEVLVSSELGVMRASTYVNILGEGFVF